MNPNSHKKYCVEVKGMSDDLSIQTKTHIDFYSLCRGFNVIDPAHAHGLKKLIMPGDRGVKNFAKDMSEGINSILDYAYHLDPKIYEEVLEKIGHRE